MTELKRLVSDKVILYVIGAIVGGILWYGETNSLNKLHDEKIANHEARIVALEQKEATDATQLAIIRVQLDQIQTDLKEIKLEIKRR